MLRPCHGDICLSHLLVLCCYIVFIHASDKLKIYDSTKWYVYICSGKAYGAMVR